MSASPPRLELVVAGEEFPRRPIWRPWLDLEVHWLDTVELGPRPEFLGKGSPLGRQERTVDRLQRFGRFVGQTEPGDDHSLERFLDLLEEAAGLAPVLDRVGKINEIGLGRVVEQRPKTVVDGAPGLLDQERRQVRMLCDRIEPVDVTPEATLVPESCRYIADLYLLRRRLERIESATAHGLNEGPGSLHGSDTLAARTRPTLPIGAS